VHYVDVVYDVLAQITLNMVTTAATSSYSSSSSSSALASRAAHFASIDAGGVGTGGGMAAPGAAKKPQQHEVCEMGRPWSALGVVLVAGAMLYFMDNFFGLPMIATRLLGSNGLNAKLTW
jgi:hypothetical protein